MNQEQERNALNERIRKRQILLIKLLNLKYIDKIFLKDALGWGFVLWLIGYILGIILFFAVPAYMIGWIIMPVGIIVALWIFKKVKAGSFRYYLFLAIVWTVIAIVFDYIFLVRALKPADGYYKLDVYLYYALTFILPILAGWRKNSRVN